jgi:hypothetical protein
MIGHRILQTLLNFHDRNDRGAFEVLEIHICKINAKYYTRSLITIKEIMMKVNWVS